MGHFTKNRLKGDFSTPVGQFDRLAIFKGSGLVYGGDTWRTKVRQTGDLVIFENRLIGDFQKGIFAGQGPAKIDQAEA